MGQEPFEKRIGDRRKFFQALFHRVSEPLADAIERPLEHLQNVARQVQPEAFAPVVDYSIRTVIRPPGAVAEKEFVSTCQQSGKCGEACPVGAIKFMYEDGTPRGGKPYIEPEVQACVACVEVPCASACPSGALKPLKQEEIHIGIAEWAIESCLRSMGQECRECVDKCPLGSKAIELDEGANTISVRLEGCTGCGVCQMNCPTYPKAITVRAV